MTNTLRCPYCRKKKMSRTSYSAGLSTAKIAAGRSRSVPRSMSCPNPGLDIFGVGEPYFCHNVVDGSGLAGDAAEYVGIVRQV